MFSSELLFQVFIVFVVANIAILELAVFLLWRRRRVGATEPAAADARLDTPNVPFDELAGRGAMARDGDAATVAATFDDTSPPSTDDSGEADDPPAQPPFVDPATGLETAAVWYDALRHEDARRARYGHAATVMVMELVGFELLGERLGAEVADRLIVPVAATLQRNSRAADRIARVGHTRFQVLMPETDEISAINYVERVRETTDMWLEAGAVAVRTAIGWASPPNGGSLVDAARLADERMQADRHARPRSGGRAASPRPSPSGAA